MLHGSLSDSAAILLIFDGIENLAGCVLHRDREPCRCLKTLSIYIFVRHHVCTPGEHPVDTACTLYHLLLCLSLHRPCLLLVGLETIWAARYNSTTFGTSSESTQCCSGSVAKQTDVTPWHAISQLCAWGVLTQGGFRRGWHFSGDSGNGSASS